MDLLDTFNHFCLIPSRTPGVVIYWGRHNRRPVSITVLQRNQIGMCHSTGSNHGGTGYGAYFVTILGGGLYGDDLRHLLTSI
jgi:hypothetical protein